MFPITDDNYFKYKEVVPFLDILVIRRTIQLSRIYNKTEEEQIELYYSINSLIDSYNKGIRISRDALYLIFYPLIRKTIFDLTYKLVKKGKIPLSICQDLLQESFIMFNDLLDNYNKSTFFPYYIKKFIKFSVDRYLKRYINYSKRILVSIAINSQALDKRQNTERQALFNLFYNDYIKFINILKTKKYRRSGSWSIVCDEYFVNYKTILQIANELGLTYHSIYQIVSRIQDELYQLINDSKYTNFNIKVEKRFKYDRRGRMMPSQFKLDKI